MMNYFSPMSSSYRLIRVSQTGELKRQALTLEEVQQLQRKTSERFTEGFRWKFWDQLRDGQKQPEQKSLP
jgi:hypothetical protein